MKAFTVVLFIVCLNIAGLIVANLVAQDVLTTGEFSNMPYSEADIRDMFNPFSFSPQNLVYGILGGGIAALIGLITRNGTFAIYAVIIFLIGMFINIFSWVLFGLPKFMDFMLAGTGMEWLSYMVATVMYVFFFWFLAEVMAQRQLMT